MIDAVKALLKSKSTSIVIFLQSIAFKIKSLTWIFKVSDHHLNQELNSVSPNFCFYCVIICTKDLHCTYLLLKKFALF